MKKRLLSTLMTLCLCLTLVPLALTTTAAATGTAVTYTAVDGTAGNAGENYTNLVDGKNSEGNFTKWCVQDATAGAYVVIKASSAVKLESYTLITGNDTATNSGRNPTKWTVYGSNDYDESAKDGTWTQVDRVTNGEMPAENFASRTFTVTSDTAYQYFMLKIAEIEDGNLFQLCGISLSGSADSGGAAAVSPDYDWYDADESEFTITTAAQLLGFANLVNGADGQTATTFAGKTVKLGADIDLSGIANWTPISNKGSTVFTGTFDGQGKTISKLTVNSTGQNNYVGLFGRIVDATVQNLAVSGSVSGSGTYSEVGGIIGSLGGGSVENCSFSGSVTGSGNYVGGIAGDMGGGSIESCSVSGSVTGSGQTCKVGGIAGLSGSGLISKCKNTATISGSNSAQAIGGIVGSIGQDTEIRYCCNQGELTNYGNYVGGLVGYLAGVYSDIPLRSCYTTFDVCASADSGHGAAIGCVDIDNPITVSGIYVPVSESRETSWVGRIADSDITIIGEGESKSTDAFANGEVAWLLQNAADASDGQVWGQTLTGSGKDAYPVFADESGSNTVYKVTFVDDGVSTVKYVNSGTITVSAPTKDGYAFGGWYTAATGGTKVTAISSDLCDTGDGADANSITLYAGWICAGAHTGGMADCMHKAVCTACGEPYGDFGAHSYTVENKDAAGALKTAGDCQNEAVYYKSCSVCGVVSTSDVDIFEGEKDPTRHTGTLGGWQKDEEGHWKVYSCCTNVKGDEGTHSFTDSTCVCGAVKYTVTLDPNGGTLLPVGVADTINTDTDGKIPSLPTSTRDGYRFEGWYTAQTGGTQVTEVTADTTLYAVWQIITYNITYDGLTEINEADLGNPDTYTVESDTIVLNNPTRTGYAFTGWLGTGLGTDPTITVTIAQNSTGDRSYTANWQQLYLVTFHANGGTVDTAFAYANADNKLTTLPVPTLIGNYRFVGWFTDKSGGTEVTTATVFTENTTVYAHWVYTGGSTYTYYAIKAGAGTGGSISPSGSTLVRHGGSITFTITPDSGYAIADVKIDGQSFGAVTSYTFTDTKKNHTITVTFTEDTTVPEPTMDFPFTDVDKNDWFYEDVAYVYAAGLMKGTDETVFNHDLTTTRGMIVTILYRLEGEPSVSGNCPFEDVESGSYCEKAIIWAEANGIVGGYGDGKFAPNDPITREQMAVILYRYARYKNPNVTVSGNVRISDYKDAANISEYALSAMQWVCDKGIMKGDNDGNLMPRDNATRAQVAALLHRFCESILK